MTGSQDSQEGAVRGRGTAPVCRDRSTTCRCWSALEGDPTGVAGAVDSLLEQSVDGVVISEPIDDGNGEDLSARGDVPVLVGAPPLSTPETLTVGGGADLMARTATEYLLELGHETVHHLAGPQRWYAARDRLEGWRSTLASGRLRSLLARVVRRLGQPQHPAGEPRSPASTTRFCRRAGTAGAGARWRQPRSCFESERGKRG
ncbi:MAG: hypothetical protein JF597_15410 [Streptomyces sp.]|nr:hypothetical protein [Streptomyces sp.]